MKQTLVKRYLLCNICVFLPWILIGQQLSHEVISSGAINATNGQVSLNSTIGEFSINTFSQGSILYVEGFGISYLSPPPDTSPVIVKDPVDVLYIHPNPTNGITKVSYLNATGELSYHLYDLRGAMLREGRTEAEEAIDFSMLNRGTYLLYIKESQSYLKSFKLIKQ